MGRYIFKRILSLIPIIIGITFIVFTLMELTPGDPATIILGDTADPVAIEKLNEELGHNRPFFTKYFDFVTNMLKGDFGTSYRTRQPVVNEIKVRLPISFKLAFLGLAFSAIIGIPLGVIAAVKQYTLADTIPSVLAMVLSAVPSFWMGMMLIYYLSYKLGLLPSYGLSSWDSYILPTITIGAVYAASMVRYTRSSMLETIRADYIRTARAKGAEEKTVIWKHAMKNGLLPVVTVLGSSFGAQIGGAIVTENLFSIAGLGNLTITSIALRDTPTVMATTVVFAILYNVILLFVDIIYAFIDPRIKAKYVRAAAK